MIFRGVLLVLALVVAAPVSADEAYPTRPVTSVGPFPPGGIADLAARPLAAAIDKAQTPIADQDADEFKAWWDRGAARLAEVIEKIGRVELK